jgi:hypothetical protein
MKKIKYFSIKSGGKEFSFVISDCNFKLIKYGRFDGNVIFLCERTLSIRGTIVDNETPFNDILKIEKIIPRKRYFQSIFR